MVGGAALRLYSESEEVGSITVIGRRPTGVSHPKVIEVLHSDFENYAAVGEHLAGHDVALFCLGVYTGAVPDDEFRRITVDYTVAFARALRERSPGAAFCFLSGQGADPKEQSRVAFARYKGIAENALLQMGFERLHIFRPGYIYPVEKRREPNLAYRVMRALYPIGRHIYLNVGLTSEELAAAMVHAGLHGTPNHADRVLENRDIRRMVAGLRLGESNAGSRV